jgi:hypothetical protein
MNTMNTSKCPRVCERGVKETVRIDLVKAPRQARFILMGRRYG